MKTNNTIAWRIQSLEKKVDDLNTDVNNLLQNHIPHINEQMASLKILKENALPDFTKSSNLRNILVHEYDFDEDNFIFYKSAK